MNGNEIELLAISDMLKHSKEHNLQVECVWSMIHEISGISRHANSEEIAQACTNALCEWDI